MPRYTGWLMFFAGLILGWLLRSSVIAPTAHYDETVQLLRSIEMRLSQIQRSVSNLEYGFQRVRTYDAVRVRVQQ